MKIWVSPDKEKNRYRGGAAWKAAGIAVVMMALTVITVALSFFLSASFGISREQILMTGCILTVLFGVWLSVRLGNRVLRDAQIFFTDDDGCLYVLDARLFIQYRRGFPGFARMDRDMRKEKEAILQQMRKEHLMPAGAVKRTSDACRGSGDRESRQYAGTKPELLAGLPGKIRSRGYGKAYLSPGKRL